MIYNERAMTRFDKHIRSLSIDLIQDDMPAGLMQLRVNHQMARERHD